LDDVEIPVDWRADEEMPVSPFKIREVHAFLKLLEDHKHESWNAAAIRSQLDALRGIPEVNRWWRFLDEIRSEWAGEAGETEVPITLVRDFFVEAIAERRRHHRTGDGVVLVTAHKAKGLEFPHVIIADGGWRPTADAVETEEERRVFYVAMTRAMETLSVMVRRDQRTLFSKEIAGADVIDRTPREVELAANGFKMGRRYAIIDPTELFLSYAASMTATSEVHLAIKRLSVGDSVQLVPQGKWVHIETLAGIPIAALSELGRSKWTARIPAIRSAIVTAMVRRTKDQESEAYRDKAQVASWEYPIVEVSWIEQ